MESAAGRAISGLRAPRRLRQQHLAARGAAETAQTQQERNGSAVGTAKTGEGTEQERREDFQNRRTNSRLPPHERQGTRSERHKKEGRNTSGPPVGETRFAIRGTRAGYQPQRPSRRHRPRSGPWRASAGSCRDSLADLRSARHGRPSARPTRLRNRSAG